MPRRKPIILNLMPSGQLAADTTAYVVLRAYSAANGKRGFEAAVQAWQEHHPNATPEEGATAVANIICNHM